MTEYLELWQEKGRGLVRLEADQLTVGHDASNDISIDDDPTVSQLHAVLQRYGSGWSLKDVGSSNGTFVNGERILGERRLRAGDEIRVGRTVLTFRSDEAGERSATASGEPPPQLTRRERDVLVALCRPVLSADVFTEPASIREIAGRLVVTEAAIKQHLVNLYDKFAVHDEGSRRRVTLANEAIRRGAVSFADLKADAEE